jgi:phosphoribosylglycinamide formyltransferase-1
MEKKRVAVFASGGGSNLQALLDAAAAPDYPARIVLVFSDKEGARALARGIAAGAAVAHLDPKAFPDRGAFDEAAGELVEGAGADLICLAGYMRILTPAFVRRFAGRIMNIHPALLPRFGGPGMYGHHVHEAVLAAGVAESGATVHWVDEGVDTGRIILQARVPVLPGDTPETLAARVLEQEHRVYPEALARVCLGTL